MDTLTVTVATVGSSNLYIFHDKCWAQSEAVVAFFHQALSAQIRDLFLPTNLLGKEDIFPVL